MALTDTAIRNAKPAQKPIKLTDERGLYLLLKPNGSRWWRFDYRYGGKRKTLSMGVYPDVSLKDARNRRDEARKLLAFDADPGENVKRSKPPNPNRGRTVSKLLRGSGIQNIPPPGMPVMASVSSAGLSATYFPGSAVNPLQRLPRLNCWQRYGASKAGEQ